jgi:hypothetical protein
MKRNKSRLAAVFTLTVSLILSLQGVDLACANYCPPPSIEVYQPYSGAVYSNSSVPLSVRVNILTGESWITSIRYSIDAGNAVKLTNLTREENLYYWTDTKGVFAHGEGFSVATTIDNLSEGNHTLVIISHAANGEEMSRTKTFIVDNSYVTPQDSFASSNGTSIEPNASTTPSNANMDNLQLFKNPLTYVAIILVGILIITMLVLRKTLNKS